MQKSQLLKQIEDLREALEKVILEKKDFQDQSVIEMSQKLDKLLVEYSRLINNDNR